MVGGGAEDGVDLACLDTGHGERGIAGLQRHFGHLPGFVIGPFTEPRMHYVGVQHAGLVEDVALLDARGGDDEFGRGMLPSPRPRPRRSRGVGLVPAVDIGVEGGDKLIVGDDFGRREDPVPGDGGLMHVSLPGGVCADAVKAARGQDSRLTGREGQPILTHVDPRQTDSRASFPSEDAQGLIVGTTLMALSVQFLNAAAELFTGQIAGLSIIGTTRRAGASGRCFSR
jgi:hypothetical protein